MSKDLTLTEFKKLKIDLEIGILDYIRKAVKKFHIETGVSVYDIELKYHPLCFNIDNMIETNSYMDRELKDVIVTVDLGEE